MHLSEKTPEEIAEALSIDLGTVQSVITNWRKRDEPVFTRKKGSKTSVRVKAMLFSGGKSISTREMRRELERLGLKHCVVVIKPLREGGSQ